MILNLLFSFALYTKNTEENYEEEGTKRAIWLSQSFSRDED